MNRLQNKSLLIIAGEVSGDLHGASLVSELKKLDGSIEIYGIGGEKMKAAGVELKYHINKMAFLGFTEVVKHLPFIRKVKKDILSEVDLRNTKYAVLIDYPGFNLNIAKKLKSRGVEIAYYISPQIWAWGTGRIAKIKRLVSKMLVVFPFEEKLYRDNDVNAEFVGHPIINRLDEHKFLSREELINKFSLHAEKEILLLLPGSRNHEVEEIFPEVIKAASKIAIEFDMQIVVANSENLELDSYKKFQIKFDFKLISGHTYDLLKIAKFGIIKSGTSTLEAGLLQLPMVIVYKTSAVTYRIGKMLVKLKNIGLANIVLGKTVVPELVQNDVSYEKIYEHVSKILNDKILYNNILSELGELKSKLGSKNASFIAASAIHKMMNES